MAKQIFTAFVAVLLGVVMSFSFVACSSDYDEDLVIEKKDPTPDPTPDDNETPTDNIWTNYLGREAHLDGDNVFTNIFVGGTRIERDTLNLNHRLLVEIGDTLFLKGKGSSFTGAVPEPFEYTAESTRADGVTWKKETGMWHLGFETYSRDLRVERLVGYVDINNQKYDFLWENYTLKVDLRTDNKEVIRNDSIFNRQIDDITVTIIFDARNKYTVKTVTVLENFIKLVEKKQDNEEMPSVDQLVAKIKKVNNITFSPVFEGDNLVAWRKVCLIECVNNEFYLWVDGVFTKVDQPSIAGTYNSAYYADGAWRPAFVATDGRNGWSYTFYVSGVGKVKNVSENLAVTSGLKNFRKSNSASQTPEVYTLTETKTFGDKKWMRVTGYNIDDKPVISFTIGEK